MDVYARLKKVARNLSFEQVVKAMREGMHNISSADRVVGGRLEKFLNEEGLAGVPVIFLANNSMGGRSFRSLWKDGMRFAFFEDNDEGDGWNVLTADDADYIQLISARSGSSLTAEHCFGDPFLEGWELTLEVPVRSDGSPYRGVYWNTFHEALGFEDSVYLHSSAGRTSMIDNMADYGTQSGVS